MKIIPFESFGGSAFGASVASIVAVKGAPLRETAKKDGVLELAFPGVFYRFEPGGTLVEMTADAACLELGNDRVSFQGLPAYFREHDVSTFEVVGFLVSPRFGVALDPAFPNWTTAMSQLRLELWRRIHARAN